MMDMSKSILYWSNWANKSSGKIWTKYGKCDISQLYLPPLDLAAEFQLQVQQALAEPSLCYLPAAWRHQCNLFRARRPAGCAGELWVPWLCVDTAWRHETNRIISDHLDGLWAVVCYSISGWIMRLPLYIIRIDCGQNMLKQMLLTRNRYFQGQSKWWCTIW